jgi:hypothetical protein
MKLRSFLRLYISCSCLGYNAFFLSNNYLFEFLWRAKSRTLHQLSALFLFRFLSVFILELHLYTLE